MFVGAWICPRVHAPVDETVKTGLWYVKPQKISIVCSQEMITKII